jgi:hypothetical protein
VKVPRDITLEEISKFFGPIVNKNGYNYEFTKDLSFIEEIETLWWYTKSHVCQHHD